MQPNLYGAPAPTAFFESRAVVPFCQLQPAARAGVSTSLGIFLPSAVFAELQAVYQTVEGGSRPWGSYGCSPSYTA